MRRRQIRRMAALLRRFQLTALVQRHDPTRMLALFGLINGGASVGLLAAVAHITRSPFLFPSLGPTAFLLFYEPTAAVSSPRNTLLGHLVGAAAGWLSLAVFGLLDAAPVLLSGVSWAHVGAAAFSLGGTSALMILLRSPHPPAGATTLIVSLGLMPHLWQIPVLLAAVLLLLAQALVINRLAGMPYPLWNAPEPRQPAADPREVS